MSDKRHAPLAKVVSTTTTKTTIELTESHVHRAIVDYLRKHGYESANHDTVIVIEGLYTSDALEIDSGCADRKARAVITENS